MDGGGGIHNAVRSTGTHGLGTGAQGLLGSEVSVASLAWLRGGCMHRGGRAAQTCERSTDQPSSGASQSRIRGGTREDTRLWTDGGLGRESQGNDLELYLPGESQAEGEGLRHSCGILH